MRERLRGLLLTAPMLAVIGVGTVAGVAGRSLAVATPAANSALACVAPTDVDGIRAVLTAAGSPLADNANVIVDAGVAHDIDPRFIVAVAAHETLLETYAPAQRINNPFGLGPGMVFADDADAVRYAARLLARWYVGEGRSTIPLIGSKWAPVGVANDPQGLNAHWSSGVSGYYSTLGGDPYREVRLSTQSPTPDCAAGNPVTALEQPPATTPAPIPAAGAGPAVVVVWGGNVPAVSGRTTVDGADPDSGLPAAISGFVFPVAAPRGAQVWFDRGECAAGGLCTVTLRTAPDVHVVAALDGRLVGATAGERRAGIAFWILRADGERVGYGPLASYAPGVTHGAEVRAGTPIGRTTGSLDVAWTRSGTPIHPYPLLAATRPPDPAPSR